jgi:tRNA threonylcarbamoyladenosine biosynthesis protein TsaB
MDNDQRFLSYNMNIYIAIQHTYDTFEMALFIEGKLIDKIQEDKRHTSKLFIPLLQQLLSKNAITFAELSFCAVNCGPGPFSTLRSILASVNGLHCATNIPLIGIDGLEATLKEFGNPDSDTNIVLLNAFNNESYYLIAQGGNIMATGYKNIDLLLNEIENQFPENNVHIIDNKICSLETIAKMGYKKFKTHEYKTDYLMPLHLKKHTVELR